MPPPMTGSSSCGSRTSARHNGEPSLTAKALRFDWVSSVKTVGLTAVTWLPAFAVNLDASGNEWLASRPKRRCATPSSSRPKRFKEYYRRTDAQLETSTAQQYRCTYQTARLLYWARLVPDAPAGAAS